MAIAGRSPAATFASLATAGFAWFVFAVLAMHVLRPDYEPARHFLSDYAVGRFGGVMTSAFLALAAGCLGLALGLLRAGPPAWPARAGAVLLLVAAAGLVVTARFETDLPGQPFTRSGDLHELSFLVNVASLMLAAVLLTLAFAADPRWRAHRPVAAALLAAVLVAFALQFRAIRSHGPVGLYNRAFAGLLVAWLLATALRLRTASRT